MEEEAAQTVHYQHVFPSVMAAAVEMASLAVEMAVVAVEMACETSPVLHFLFSLVFSVMFAF